MEELSKEETQNMVLDGIPAIKTQPEVMETIEKITAILEAKIEPDSDSMTSNWKYALATIALWRDIMLKISSSDRKQIEASALTIAFTLGRLRQAYPVDLMLLKADMIKRFGKFTMEEMLPKENSK